MHVILFVSAVMIMRSLGLDWQQRNHPFTGVEGAGNAYGPVKEEFIRLLFVLAFHRAGNTIAFHHPCADFWQHLGEYVAADQAQIVMIFAKFVTFRACSLGMSVLWVPVQFDFTTSLHLGHSLDRIFGLICCHF